MSSKERAQPPLWRASMMRLAGVGITPLNTRAYVGALYNASRCRIHFLGQAVPGNGYRGTF